MSWFSNVVREVGRTPANVTDWAGITHQDDPWVNLRANQQQATAAGQIAQMYQDPTASFAQGRREAAASMPTGTALNDALRQRASDMYQGVLEEMNARGLDPRTAMAQDSFQRNLLRESSAAELANQQRQSALGLAYSGMAQAASEAGVNRQIGLSQMYQQGNQAQAAQAAQGGSDWTDWLPLLGTTISTLGQAGVFSPNTAPEAPGGIPS